MTSESGLILSPDINLQFSRNLTGKIINPILVMDMAYPLCNLSNPWFYQIRLRNC